jgi:phosphotransferase system HPr (HPr) family protein
MLELSFAPADTPITRLRAEKFVVEACRFESSIIIRHSNRTINGKSMLGLLSLGKIDGDVTLICDGADEKRAGLILRDLLTGAYVE